MLSPAERRSELAALRAATSKPFNVNFFCHTEVPRDPVREAVWRATLSPYYVEAGLELTTIPDAPGREPFDAEAADDIVAARPAVVSFHFGLPDAALMDRVKSCGARVLASATTVDEARWLESHGADAIVAQGFEAGGHRGIFLSDDLSTQLGTLALVPQVVAAVRVPVIAAGGIADARGVAAAMALGAQGVQVGTAFLLCPEATTSAVHRAALKSDAARHTAVTNLITGRPARGIVNRLMRELGPMNAAAPAFPHALTAIQPLRTHAEREGRHDFSPLWAGQNVSACREVPASAVVEALVHGLSA
jgi:nitronate monooxygenase